MITLTIDQTPDGTEEASRQQIVVSHFKFRHMTVEQARDGLGHCPGVLIVLPRSGEESFTVDGTPFLLPPERALLLSGESQTKLSSLEAPEPQVDRQHSLGMIEINAVINTSFRLQDVLTLPLWLNHHESSKIADLYHDLIYGDQGGGSPSAFGEDVVLPLAAARVIHLALRSAKQSPTDKVDARGDEQLKRLRQYLLANLSNRITTTDMAAHLGLTRTHFCRRAKALLGEAPRVYLRRIRLERSLELLEHTTETIEAIADDTGYADRFTFSKEFKRDYGCSPVQYRKQARSKADEKTHSKAQALFDHRRFEQALALCTKSLARAGADADTDPICYLQGRCLFALGRSDEALAAWSNLQTGAYAWQAGMQRSRMYFGSNHFAAALGELEKLWAEADGLKHNDVVQLWTEQADALMEKRRTRPLARYLAFREARFVGDKQSAPAARLACRNTGDILAILRHFPGNIDMHVHALRGAARYEEVLERYGSQMEQESISRILLDAGRYDEVLSLGPGIPGHCAKALTRLGRLEEALQRYPEDCLEAHLVLGQYQEVVDKTAAESFERITALHALGRTEELKSYSTRGDWYWHCAQLYVRPGHLLKENTLFSPIFALKARLLLALQSRKTQEGVLGHLAHIPQIGAKDFWPGGQENLEILLRHAIPVLLGDRHVLQQAMETIRTQLRYFEKQKLYHDAAYLTGEIDLNTWRQQPLQEHIGAREQIMQALQHDLGNRLEDASHAYQAYLDNVPRYSSDSLLSERFAEWRMSCLE